MRRRTAVVLAAALAIAAVGWAHQPPTGERPTPGLLRFSGAIPGAQGTLGVTFALYAQQTGGAPLWLETQSVQVYPNGRYTILLGAHHALGVPAVLFASGEARWLGVQPDGQAEQPRVILVSVPYALSAANADTLGGLPAAAYLRAPVDANGNYVNPTFANGQVWGAAVSGTGTAGKLVKWADGAGALTDSVITESGSTVSVAGGVVTTEGSGVGVIAYPNVRLNVGGTQGSGDNAFGMYMGSLTLRPSSGWDAYFHYGGGGTVDTGAGNSISKAVAFYGELMQKAGSGTIANTYGLWVNASTTGTNNYGAYIGGKTGIGTSTPAEQLEVVGNVKINGTPGTEGVIFPDGTKQTTAATGGGITSIGAGDSSITVAAADRHAR
jgi:hypothetical protein